LSSSFAAGCTGRPAVSRLIASADFDDAKTSLPVKDSLTAVGAEAEAQEALGVWDSKSIL
jgi:hypothetical protein